MVLVLVKLFWERTVAHLTTLALLVCFTAAVAVDLTVKLAVEGVAVYMVAEVVVLDQAHLFPLLVVCPYLVVVAALVQAPEPRIVQV
jgi:hypothetical protein